MSEPVVGHKKSGMLGTRDPAPAAPPSQSAYLERMQKLAKRPGASPAASVLNGGEEHPASPAAVAEGDGLGRNDSALPIMPIASHAPIDELAVGTLVLLRVRSIKPSPYQPRVRLDPAHVDEIAESIRADSLNDPITVRPYKRINGDNLEWEFELIAGENRWEAHKILGEEFIPAIIKLYDDCQAARIAVFSNKKRGDYRPYEEFRGYRLLLDNGFVKSQNQLANDANISKAEVSRIMSFGKLPPGAHEILTRKPDLIGSNVAAALAGFADHPEYESLVVAVLEKVEAEEIDQMKAAGWVERQMVEATLAKYAETDGRKDLVAIALKKVDSGEVDHTNAIEWIEQQIKIQDAKPAARTPAEKRAVTYHGGRTFATIKPAKHGYEIDLDKVVQLEPHDQERFEVALLEFVTKFAEELPEKSA